MSKVFKCMVSQTRYFKVEADNEEQMMSWLQTHDFQDVDNLTKQYVDDFDEGIVSCSETYEPHFSIATHYYTAYAPENDLTFLMKECGETIDVVGFYWGEPNDDFTEYWKNRDMKKGEKAE